ncbi:MAG: nitrogen regulation protein NR(II) [Candidatus Binatia bacterium]
MRAAQNLRGRHAECAYLLDRAVKNPSCADEFARAALDSIRLALRPSYAALVCRGGSGFFRCGDGALSADVDAAAEILSKAPRSLLARPTTLRRSEAAGAGLAGLEHRMSASALDLVFPLGDDASLLGVVALGPRADRRPYSAEDVEFLDRIGARVATVASREVLASEAVALRAQAAGSERLASVGRMAAGLAHEIRNPLVSIRTFTQLLPERHADEEFRSSFLDLTLSEIDRISTLVGEILSYARPAAPAQEGDAPSATDVADCVERTCLLLRSHARSAGVVLDFAAADLPSRAAIDEDKLRQVVINLVVNGIQACGGRGRVTVAASAAPDGRICVKVSDDGPGMPPEVASRIFEPFFTTRREGTGLGLALVQRILDEVGATISVVTAPECGTTFRVDLPTDAAAFAGAAAATAWAGSPGRDSAPHLAEVEDLPVLLAESVL